MLTEQAFCRKSSINIAINNRYYNRFIHIGRPTFPVNRNGAALCLQSRHLGSRMCVAVLHSRGTSRRICDLSHIIPTWQLNAFIVPSIHYVSNNRIYFLPHLFAGTNSITIDLMTMKDWFVSQHRPLAPPHQQTCHFFLADVIAGDCRMTLKCRVLQKICCMKTALQFISTFGHNITLSLEIFRACTVISIKYQSMGGGADIVT